MHKSSRFRESVRNTIFASNEGDMTRANSLCVCVCVCVCMRCGVFERRERGVAMVFLWCCDGVPMAELQWCSYMAEMRCV